MQSISLIDAVSTDQQNGEKKFHHKSVESGADTVNNIKYKKEHCWKSKYHICSKKNFNYVDWSLPLPQIFDCSENAKLKSCSITGRSNRWKESFLQMEKIRALISFSSIYFLSKFVCFRLSNDVLQVTIKSRHVFWSFCGSLPLTIPLSSSL